MSGTLAPQAAGVLMLLSGGAGTALLARRGRSAVDWPAAGFVIGSAGWWLLVNGPYEIKVLWEVAPTHGLTLADLPGLAVGGIGGLLGLRAAGVRLPRRLGGARSAE